MSRRFLSIACVALLAVASTFATGACPNRCTDLKWAKMDCMSKGPRCAVKECSRGPRGSKRFVCAPTPKPSPMPSMRPVKHCPSRCTDLKWAKMDCARTTAACKVIECSPGPKGFKRFQCAPTPRPTPPPMPRVNHCPNRCTDLMWARKDCGRTTASCKVVECSAGPLGYKRFKCGPKPTIAPTMPPMPRVKHCPNRCTDLKWAKMDCGRTSASCAVVECTAGPKGFKRFKCGPKPVVGKSPCPNKCIDRPWAMKECMLAGDACELIECPRAANGFRMQRCAEKRVAPKPPCPNKCIDRPWAMKECMLAGDACELIECPRAANGFRMQRCAEKRVVSKSPCPNKCIDRPWAMKECMLAGSACELIECPRAANGFRMQRCAEKRT